MTLAELAASEREMLRPQDVGAVLGCNPYVISLMARDGNLPFPYIRSGNRTKIPKAGFIRWMTGGGDMQDLCDRTK